MLATAQAVGPPEFPPLPPGAIAHLGAHPMTHPERVHSVEFAPDGRSLLTVDGDAWVWDAATGGLLRRIEVSAMCGALSPDGHTIAIAENGSEVHLFDAATGQLRTRLLGARERSSAVAWSPDGKWLATTDRGAILLWDVAHGKLDRRWPAENKAAEDSGEVALQFSPDGRRLATASRRGSIRLRALDEKEDEVVLEGGTGFVPWLRFSPDGTVLAGSCEVPGQRRTTLDSVRFWNAQTGKKRGDIPGSFNAGAFSPDGATFAATGLGFVRIYDAESRIVRQRVAESNEHFWCVAFSADGKTLAAGQGARVRRWATDTWEEIQPGTGHGEPVQAVAFAPDGRTLATGGLDRTIRIWSWPEGRELRCIKDIGTAWGVQHLVYSHDGRTLCSTAWANGRDMFYLHDPATGELRARFGKDHPGRDQAAFLPGGKEIVTGQFGGTLGIWDAATGRWLREVGTWRSGIWGVLPAADGHTAFWAGEYQGLGLRDLATGADVRLFTGSSHHSSGALAVSPDGGWLAVGNRVWDAQTGRQLSDPGSEQRDTANAASPDGRYLFAGGQLWDSITRRPFAMNELPAASKDAVFSPDGTVLVTAGTDGALVWDLTGGLLQNGRLPALPLTAAELETLWQTLGGDDDRAAYLAAWKLAAGGKAAVEFLQTRVCPAEAPERPQVEALRARFTQPDRDARDRAARALLDLGVELREEDWQALRRPDLRARELSSRAVLPGDPVEAPEEVPLLPPPVLRPLPDRLRSSRAVLALRRSPAREAMALLEALAEGAPEMPLTREAKAACRALTR